MTGEVFASRFQSHVYIIFAIFEAAIDTQLQLPFLFAPTLSIFKMLLKFTSSDIENTSILDCSTGAAAYYVSTSSLCARSRSQSTSSLRSSASGGPSSKEKLYLPEQKITSLLGSDGQILAEILWEERHASVIRIGRETLAGTGEIFDAAFVKVLYVIIANSIALVTDLYN